MNRYNRLNSTNKVFLKLLFSWMYVLILNYKRLKLIFTHSDARICIFIEYEEDEIIFSVRDSKFQNKNIFKSNYSWTYFHQNFWFYLWTEYEAFYNAIFHFLLENEVKEINTYCCSRICSVSSTFSGRANIIPHT